MSVNPYVHYDGNCEAAFKFYEKELGGEIGRMARYADGPPEMCTPDSKNKIMHGEITIDGTVVMGADSPPGHFNKAQGFSLTLTVTDPTEAERKFAALSKGGAVTMPWSATFFAKGFGMGVDQFGIPWMVISPMH